MPRPLVDANLLLLKQALTVLGELRDAEYTAIPCPWHDSSIGQHLRHILDHYRALVLAKATTLVDYNRRWRDSPMEHSVVAAKEQVRAAMSELASMQPATVRVRSEIDANTGFCVDMTSSVERELLFAASHAIHHFALVAILLRALGKPVPEGLGIAPTTLLWRNRALAETE